ncbi:MAG TPA: DUF2225 domain-containing protein [Desulfobacteria bacterium]|nr:DUF2225 domain-containing protein [Desulfobacteria bacterium]
MDFKNILKAGYIKTFSTDEVVFNEGDPGEEMFIILSGAVDVYMTSVDGFPISIAQLGPGDFLGEMSLLEGQSRSASVRALEETKVIAVNKGNFEEVFYHEPQLAYRIMKGLSSRLRKQNDKIRRHKLGNETTIKSGENSLGEEYIASLAGLLPFPEGHKQYSVIAPDDHEEFLFQKKIQCPVCGQSFNAPMVRSTKLRLQCIDADFRQRYMGFEPLWYLIWVCPHCYYANFNYQFTQIPPDIRKSLLDAFMKLREKMFFAYTSPRDIDQVFVAYYLALNCITKIRPDAEQIGRIWLRLSWLYQDMGDTDMFRLATDKALEYYQKLRNGRVFMASDSIQGQRLYLLLGELFLRNGQLDEALVNYHKAIMHDRGSRSLNRQANDRILELKKTAGNG